MRLTEISNLDFKKHTNLSIERSLCEEMVKRLVEDLELSLYVLARDRKLNNDVDTTLVRDVISLIEKGTEISLIEQSPQEGIATPETVEDYAKAPLEHSPEAL